MTKVAVIMPNGCEEIEALTVVDLLRRVNIGVDIVALDDEYVIGAHQIIIKADKLLKECDSSDYTMLVLPGGLPGAHTLRDNLQVQKMIKDMDKAGKWLAAICAAPIALEAAGVTNERLGTAYPGFAQEAFSEFREDIVVVDNKMITARGPALAMPFALTIIRNLTDDKTAEKLAQALQWKMLESAIRDKAE